MQLDFMRLRPVQALKKYSRSQRAKAKRTRSEPKPNISRKYNYNWLIYLVALLLILFLAAIGFLASRLVNLNPQRIESYPESTGKVHTENILLFTYQAGTGDAKYIEDTYLLSFDQRENLINLIRIDQDYQLNIVNTGKKSRLATAYNLARQKLDESNAMVAVVNSVQVMMGVKINDFVVIDQNSLIKIYPETASSNRVLDNVWDIIRRERLSGLPRLISNIDVLNAELVTTMDRDSLLAFIRNISELKLGKVITMEENYGLSLESEIGHVFVPDLSLIDQLMRQMHSSNLLIAEQIKVEVFNGTNVPGLATRIARRLGNYGINVVRFTNAPRSESDTKIFLQTTGSANENIDVITELLGTSKVLREEYEYNSTGDIVIVIGEDLAKFY